MSNQTPKSANLPPASASQSENLWPKLAVPSNTRTPVAILKVQAGLLGQMTHNIVRAEVKTFKSETGDMLIYGFALVAPALDNYTIYLFQVHHKPTELYPLQIVSDVIVPVGKSQGLWSAPNEHEFKRILKVIFANPKTTTAIRSLMAQSQGAAPPGSGPTDNDTPLAA
jgi:hypothetical protein